MIFSKKQPTADEYEKLAAKWNRRAFWTGRRTKSGRTMLAQAQTFAQLATQARLKENQS